MKAPDEMDPKPCDADSYWLGRLDVVRKKETHNAKEWLEFELQGETVARANILREGPRVTVKFITIHPAYERQGLAREIVGMLKESHPVVVAQGVKFHARGFWEKCGFVRVGRGKNYLWKRPGH